MRILFLSAHLPSPQACQAGQKTMYHACQWFARKHTVDLLSFATETELDNFQPEDMSSFRSYAIVPVTNASRVAGLLRRPQLPIVAASRHSGEFRRKLRELVRGRAFDFAYVEFTGMMQYRNALAGIPFVAVMEVDVTFRWWQRRQQHARNLFSKALFGWEARRTRRWELEQLHRMDLALVQNDAEKKVLEELLPDVPVHCLRPWIELGGNETLPAYTERESDSLVFWGAMDRVENLDAVAHACEQILPRVWRERPQARFYVAGNNPPAGLLCRYPDSPVTVCGFVDKPFAFLASKRMALLPMRLGAGIKVKVLECMTAAMPVVTTPAGAEGIPGRDGVHFLVGRSENELADGVLTLLNAPERAAEMGLRAREVIVGNHFFEEPLRTLEQQILARRSMNQKEGRQSGMEVNR